MRAPTPGSQCDTVLRYIRRNGSITPMDAMTGFRCYRLAARVKDLRDMGYNIQTDEGEGFARYTLAPTLEDLGQASLFDAA